MTAFANAESLKDSITSKTAHIVSPLQVFLRMMDVHCNLTIFWVDTDTYPPTKSIDCSWRSHPIPLDTLTVIDHREPNGLESLLPPEGVEEIHAPRPLLPVAQLEEEAHLRGAAVAHEDRLEARGAPLGREDGRRDELVLHRRMVVRGEVGAIPRLRAPHVRLRGRARGDLVVARQGRELELQHAARCPRGDVLEGDGSVDGVVGGAALPGEGELLPWGGVIAGRGAKNIDDGWTLSCTGTFLECGAPFRSGCTCCRSG
jgi:hypothetical protein